MKNSVEMAIRKVASEKLAGKYNLAQYKEGGARHGEKVKAMLHKQVCEGVVAFAETHKDIPFYIILSVGVNDSACKMSEFLKGYKKFDYDKVETVVKMGRAYNDYNERYGKKMTDVMVRLIMRYYEKVSKEYNQFLLSLNNSRALGKDCGSRKLDYALLCKNLGIPVNEKKKANAA